jgi:hypothetical protein
MLSPVTVQNQNGHFSVMGIRKIINSLPLRQKLLRNFLLCVRSNKGTLTLISSFIRLQAGSGHNVYNSVTVLSHCLFSIFSSFLSNAHSVAL